MYDWLKIEMADFVENHWSAFVQNCRDRGIPEKDVEEEFAKYQKEDH